MRRVCLMAVLALLGVSVSSIGPRRAEGAGGALAGPVDVLLERTARPFAIGHRGAGANAGGDPSRPLENTVDSVREAFEAGLLVVEVDAQITRDGAVAVFHDDYLPDRTCLNALTLAELRARLPHVPTLDLVLEEAKRFSGGSPPSRRVVIVELKSSAPLCDPDDTQEESIVGFVVAAVRDAGMADHVMVTSFSPSLLYRAREHAPEISRVLGLNGLQFLTAEQIERLSGLPVTVIDKEISLGLEWGEIGSLLRLPGYRSVAEVERTALAVGARAAEADKLLLMAGTWRLVGRLHALGLAVLGFTVRGPLEWAALQQLGVDGIYTDDVELGAAFSRRRPPPR